MVYRIEYASSSRAKCKGQFSLPHLALRCAGLVLLIAYFYHPTPQDLNPVPVCFQPIIPALFTHKPLPGTQITKGELRVGTMVEISALSVLLPPISSIHLDHMFAVNGGTGDV